MSDQLDKKLLEAILGPDTPSEMYLQPGCIEKIKQAFKDEGWEEPLRLGHFYRQDILFKPLASPKMVHGIADV